MSSRIVLRATLAAAVLAAGTAAVSCYKDATSPGGGRPVARIQITDSPFPFDSVASVNIWVDSIDASTSTDTTGGGCAINTLCTGTPQWVTISAPHKSINLLSLQQGVTADLGAGELSAGDYRAIRLVLDASKSSIKWADGSDATVNWQDWDPSHKVALYAIVESPVAVQGAGADIVIDFDVGRSFLFNYFGDGSFTLTPWLRAVNKAATGTITGTVVTDLSGSTLPVKNATVTVYPLAVDPPAPGYSASDPAAVLATGHTDADGKFNIAFLSPGFYSVVAELPDNPLLTLGAAGAVQVTVGGTQTVQVVLPAASGGGGPRVNIVGPNSVGVGGSIGLVAAVFDSAGNPGAGSGITWSLADTGVVTIGAAGDSVMVTGVRQGQARVIASSVVGATTYADTAPIQVLGAPLPVASVVVTPASATLNVGDSTYFTATARDSLGNTLTNQPISWFVSDSTVVQMFPYGQWALVRPKKSGTVTLQAASGGKSGSASITVR